MVEEMRIESPDIKAFIEELNYNIRRTGEGHMKVSTPKDTLGDKRLLGLSMLLRGRIDKKELSVKGAYTIMKAAVGDYEKSNWLRQYKSHSNLN